MEVARVKAAPSEPPDLDLPRAAQLMRTGRATPDFMERWLQASWDEPARFRRALYDAASSGRKEPIKSRPELGLDLYTDCISIHLGRARTALVVMQDGRPVDISYEMLHARSSALASLWSKAGVEVGDSLAVVLPVGLEYAVALLTGLRLGLIVTPIAPLGASYVRARLALVEPDHIAAAERSLHMLPAGSGPCLPLAARGGDATWATSHAYAADAIALRLLSPFGPQPEGLSAELSALTLHEALLRDSLFVFGLEPAERIAAPGFDPLQFQPLALLSALIAGATWVECSPADIAAQPQLLTQCGVHVLGVDARTRELIRELGADACRGVRAWFRSVNDAFDYEKWRSFAELLAASKIAGGSVLYNAASGGAHLFSPGVLADHAGRIWPAPGRTFLIAQPGAGLMPALDATGVYTPLREEEADPSLVRMVIAKLNWGWTVGGSIDLGPAGWSLPLDEIAACAQLHPRVGAASVAVLPGRWPNAAHVVLLLFVPDSAGLNATRGLLASEVKQLLARELGERHLPERVEIFALHPRHDGDALRADWCAGQYASGMLGRKARTPLFLTLSQLQWIFATHRPRTPS